MDRLVRGAYVGKLGPDRRNVSIPPSEASTYSRRVAQISPTVPPLIRIHSECFTGETIGSMRCDCGEQLAEALRQISQSETGRGVVVYLRQEGRGIGLLNKIKAYNLQDMGADTVKANELLGFQADERRYEMVGGILRDLGLAPEGADDHEKGVRLLTNNPDKVEALEQEGVKVVERVPMVPRSWQSSLSASELHAGSTGHHLQLPAHAYGGVHFVGTPGGILGASTPYGPDLEKYLRTKVEKMGHMLPQVWDSREGAHSHS
jgi:GTP cyclohydrolase II